GFALPSGEPVGRLVNGAELPDTTGAAPGAEPPQLGLHAATRGWNGGSQETVPLLRVILWVGLAVTILGVLGLLVARQRHR
ncbi:MAG TPA: hypothetical protein VFN75_07220, partial [Pseudonocardiaceae bacterium]|nr:hypothetical protein [Pseudonocardiaceae bacterium]